MSGHGDVPRSDLLITGHGGASDAALDRTALRAGVFVKSYARESAGEAKAARAVDSR